MTENESTGAETEVVAAAASISDGAYTLFIADFADTSVAWEAYEALKSVEDGRSVEIEGVIVLKREADGKLEIQKATDHSTRRGLKWGLVGGVALGLVFPPSILGSAAVLGTLGAATGKALELADALVESAVDDVVARDIKAAAKEAESETESDKA